MHTTPDYVAEITPSEVREMHTVVGMLLDYLSGWSCLSLPAFVRSARIGVRTHSEETPVTTSAILVEEAQDAPRFFRERVSTQ